MASITTLKYGPKILLSHVTMKGERGSGPLHSKRLWKRAFFCSPPLLNVNVFCIFTWAWRQLEDKSTPSLGNFLYNLTWNHFSLCWASSCSLLFTVAINFDIDIMESFLWSKSVASKDSMLRKVVPPVELIVELGLEVGLAGAVTGSNSTKLRIENFFLICVIFVFSPCWLTLSMLFLALKFGFSWRSGRCSSSPLVTSSSSVMTPACCSSSTLFRFPGIRVVLSIWVSRPTVATWIPISQVLTDWNGLRMRMEAATAGILWRARKGNKRSSCCRSFDPERK